MLLVSYDVIFTTIEQLIITLYFQFCIVFVQLSFFILVLQKTHFTYSEDVGRSGHRNVSRNIMANVSLGLLNFCVKFQRKNKKQLKLKFKCPVNNFIKYSNVEISQRKTLRITEAPQSFCDFTRRSPSVQFPS